MRKVAVFLHRYVGLLLAVFLFLSGITGSIIAFHHELDRWLNPGVMTTTPGGSQKSAEELLAVVQAARPTEFAGYVEMPQQPDAVAVVYSSTIPPDGDINKSIQYQVFVDPSSAKILGSRERFGFGLDRLHIITFLYGFHFTLHAGHWGRWIFGGIAIIWFFDSFVGLYLAWPKRTWLAIKQALTVKWRSSATRVNYDLHRSFGIWTFAVLLVLAFTGFAMNLHDELFHRLLAAVAPETESPWEKAELRKSVTEPFKTTPTQAIALADAALKEQGIEGRLGGFSKEPFKGYYFAGYHTNTDITSEHAGLWVTINDSTGKVEQVRPANGFTPGDAIHDWQFPLHSGKAFGLGGRIFISAMGLVVAMLSVTGVVIWWKKLKGRMRRPVAQPAQNAFPIAMEPATV